MFRLDPKKVVLRQTALHIEAVPQVLKNISVILHNLYCIVLQHDRDIIFEDLSSFYV